MASKREQADENEIEKAFTEAIVNYGIFDRELQKRRDAISALKQEEERLESDLYSAQRRAYTFHEELIAKKGVPAEVAALRAEIIAKMKMATKKTITVAKVEKLKTEILAMKQTLQEQCNHQFVLSYDGSKGSSSYDYDDCIRGERICVVCGFVDKEKNCGENNYATLAPAEYRMIKRDLRRLENYVRDQIWQPLEEYLDMFYESAGSRNAEWPRPAPSSETVENT